MEDDLKCQINGRWPQFLARPSFSWDLHSSAPACLDHLSDFFSNLSILIMLNNMYTFVIFKKEKISNFFFNFLLESINMFLTRFIFLWSICEFHPSSFPVEISIGDRFLSAAVRMPTPFPPVLIFSKFLFSIFRHPSFLAFCLDCLNVFIELIELSSIVLFTFQHTFSNKAHYLKHCLSNEKGFF